MTDQIPSYLKLHADNAPQAPERPDELTLLAEAVESATGRSVSVIAIREADDIGPLVLSAPPANAVDPLAPPAEDARGQGDSPESSGPAPSASAEQLVDAINNVCRELRNTRRALWEREAELAAAVPVTPRPDEEEHLADRLEAILRGGAEAVGAHAAALYLLNDDTTELKVRACWGLPEGRLLDPARPLRGSVADLEALIGHAVVLEDTTALAHWKVPEEGFPSALCVPVSSPTSPLGTLWLFSNEARDFTAEQTNMVEIIAGRIASDLDREVLMFEGVSGQDLRRQRDLVAATQFDRLPQMPPIIDDWQVAGWTVPRGEVLGEFFDWSVLPDGQLSLAVGAALGRDLEAALTATNLHTALKAHASYRHDARQMIARLNETLWTSSAGDQFGALVYALIDPESGQLQYCSSGKVGTLLTSASAADLGNSLPMGTQPEDSFRLQRDHLARGASMLLFSEGLLPLAEPSGRRRCALAQLLDDSGGASASDLAEAARALMLAKLTPQRKDCTMLVVKRT